ncbi:MAG TPA: hypothetical protein VK849_06465, partial [Longimicrobiales bacterium]|nr:hypothetical protein [Longimicrobiales bacterium]
MTSRSRPPASGEAARAAGWLGPWLAAGALGLWSADPAGPLLAIAAVGVSAAAVWGVPRSRASAVGLVLLVSGILAGFGAHRQVASVTQDWPAYWSEREERIDDLLADRMER